MLIIKKGYLLEFGFAYLFMKHQTDTDFCIFAVLNLRIAYCH